LDVSHIYGEGGETTVTGDDGELVELALLCNALADECGLRSWRRWFADRAEDLSIELAQRRIDAAIDHDPLAYFWRGQLG
jgi:hypothetical protein